MSKRTGKAIRIILLVFLIAAFCVSGFLLVRYYYQANRTASGMSALRQSMPAATLRPSPTPAPSDSAGKASPEPAERVTWQVSERFAELYAQNNELAGWITIYGTNIDYPVMRSAEDEPEKYLDTGFDGAYDANGVPFLDSRCELKPNSQNMIIYGHNMTSGIMFHDLLRFKDEAFWREHRYILFDTIYGDGIYEVVAAYLYGAADAENDFVFHEYADFGRKSKFEDYMAEIRSRRLYDTGIDVAWGDELLTLATCEYSNEDGRFVLLAKKVG